MTTPRQPSCISGSSRAPAEGLAGSQTVPALFNSSWLRSGLVSSSTAVRELVGRALGPGADREACIGCRSERVCLEHGSYSLLTYEETPAFMKGNVYVKSGYRPDGLNPALALRTSPPLPFLWLGEGRDGWVIAACST